MTLNRKKTLFICSDNYPYEGANGKLLLNLFTAGLKEQFEVHVLTHKFHADDKDSEELDGVFVHRFLSWFMFPKGRVNELLGHGNKAANYWNLITKKALPKMISKFDKQFFLSHQFSDDTYKHIETLHETYHFDAIVPIIIGYENVEAGVRFKQNHPEIKLIVYQLDPCGDNMLEKPGSLEGRLKLERDFLEYADTVITTPIIRKRFLELYPAELTDKVVEMEFPSLIVKQYEDLSLQNTGPIKCLFAGNIYNGIRDPLYTLELFGSLENDNIELHLLGDCQTEIPKELKKPNIFFHNRVSISEVGKQMQEASILVNIGNKMTNQMPSKLVDYISTGKPIVNVYKNDACPSIPFLDSYDYVLNIKEQDNFERDSLKLKEFIVGNSKNRMAQERILEKYQNCTPKYCAEMISSIIVN